MKIQPDDFRVPEGKALRLDKWPTRTKRVYKSEDHYQEMLQAQVGRLDALQQLLYASNQYALLVIFQAMDAAGKDGMIRHVMSGINPQGCQVFSFKHPSPAELAHDFLWRATENLPGSGKHVWDRRFHSITGFERHLHANGTRVVKFFLHLSKEEQRKRFLARIDEPDKNWKFNAADIEERKFWNDYKRAYEACLAATSTREAPWYVVPADDKQNARLIVSQIIVETLEMLEMQYPAASSERKRELQAIRRRLTK